MKKKRNIFDELMSGIESMKRQSMGKVASIKPKSQKLGKTKTSKNPLKTNK